jgi:uncharacterized protein (DUF2237 family)
MNKNVFGEPLQPCCNNPITGFYRDGYCRTDQYDRGSHTVCVIITQEFLEFSKSRGNDLSTPRPEYDFTGLVPGDKWCLVALRWQEAMEAGKAPKLELNATNEIALEFLGLADLISYSK